MQAGLHLFSQTPKTCFLHRGPYIVNVGSKSSGNTVCMLISPITVISIIIMCLCSRDLATFLKSGHHHKKTLENLHKNVNVDNV